ncbi:MAG: bifunctional folylpolyglutamate synthase/dihydrofolate synthase [Candidatus Poseidoniaceae archaeon]
MEGQYATVDWLESLKNRGMSLGVENTKQALEGLIGNLSDLPRTIHVAGSNGKGTLCSYLSSHLCSKGNNVTLFTSPHLFDYRERVRVNGKPISQERLEELLSSIRSYDDQNGGSLTFFEVGFIASCLESIDQGGFLILETGLGGRLDATRAVPAELCILTSLSIEHSEVLGNTIEEIAFEKAMISRPNATLLTPKYSEQIRKVISGVVQNCSRNELGEEIAACAWMECESEQYNVTELLERACEVLGVGKSEILASMDGTRWPCRGEFIDTNFGPTLFLDSAHNPSGMKYMFDTYLNELKVQLENQISNCKIIFGTSPQADMDSFVKPVLELVQTLPVEELILSKPNTGRYPGVNPVELKKYEWGVEKITCLDDISEIKEIISSSNQLIICTGSIYMLGELVNATGLLDDDFLTIHQDYCSKNNHTS